MPYVTLRYERGKLYEEVWAEAVTTGAKRYGISDVALRKICKKLAVPLPPLGYWARVAAGRKSPTSATSQIFRPGRDRQEARRLRPLFPLFDPKVFRLLALLACLHVRDNRGGRGLRLSRRGFLAVHPLRGSNYTGSCTELPDKDLQRLAWS